MKIGLDRRAFDAFGVCAAMAGLMLPDGSIASVIAFALMWFRALCLFEEDFE